MEKINYNLKQIKKKENKPSLSIFEENFFKKKNHQIKILGYFDTLHFLFLYRTFTIFYKISLSLSLGPNTAEEVFLF